MNTIKYNKNSLYIGIPLLFALALYSQTIFFNFVWDDWSYFINGPYYNLDWPQIINAFIPGQVTEAVYTPIIFIIYFVLFKVFGLSPIPYHIFSLITYIIVVYLFYQFVLLTSKKRIIASLSSLLFAIHPLHVEAVSWVSCNSYGLCLIFFLLAFNIFAKLIQSKENILGKIVLVILFHILALLCQPTAMTFPALILVYAFFFAKTNFKLAIKISIPCFVITLVYIYIQTLGVRVSRFASEFAMPWQSKIILIAKNIFNLFIPIEYMPLYPATSQYDYPTIYFIISLLFLISLIVIFIKYKSNIYRFFIIWFLVAMSPYLHIIYTPSTSMADRYLYIASMASSLLIGTICYQYCMKIKVNSFKNKILRYSPITVLIVFYFFSTLFYSNIWANGTKLWNYAYKKNSENSLVALNYASSLFDLQEDEKALETINKFIENSKTFEIYRLKIKILVRQKKYEEALKTAMLARGAIPSDCGVYEVLAQIYFMLGDYQNSAKNLKLTIKFIDNISKYKISDRIKIYLDTAMTCYFAGETQEYLKYFDIWYEKQTEFKDRLITNGLEHHKKGEYKQAGMSYYEFLQKQSSDSVHIRRLYEISKLQEHYSIEKADDILSNSVKNYMKAIELLQKGEKAQAEKLLVEIIQINPFSFDAYCALGQIYIQVNNQQGKIYLKKAYELNPSAKEIFE